MSIVLTHQAHSCLAVYLCWCCYAEQMLYTPYPLYAPQQNTQSHIILIPSSNLFSRTDRRMTHKKIGVFVRFGFWSRVKNQIAGITKCCLLNDLMPIDWQFESIIGTGGDDIIQEMLQMRLINSVHFDSNFRLLLFFFSSAIEFSCMLAWTRFYSSAFRPPRRHELCLCFIKKWNVMWISCFFVVVVVFRSIFRWFSTN